MPLKHGYSKKTIAENIKKEAESKPKSQAVAIALNTARTAAKKAGKATKATKDKK